MPIEARDEANTLQTTAAPTHHHLPLNVLPRSADWEPRTVTVTVTPEWCVPDRPIPSTSRWVPPPPPKTFMIPPPQKTTPPVEIPPPEKPSPPVEKPPIVTLSYSHPVPPVDIITPPPMPPMTSSTSCTTSVTTITSSVPTPCSTCEKVKTWESTMTIPIKSPSSSSKTYPHLINTPVKSTPPATGVKTSFHSVSTPVKSESSSSSYYHSSYSHTTYMHRPSMPPVHDYKPPTGGAGRVDGAFTALVGAAVAVMIAIPAL